MVNTVLDFINMLRKAGMKISPVELQDCLLAIECTGFSKEDFKQALKTTLVKDEKDIRVFEKLFDLYFISGNIQSFYQEQGGGSLHSGKLSVMKEKDWGEVVPAVRDMVF